MAYNGKIRFLVKEKPLNAENPSILEKERDDTPGEVCEKKNSSGSENILIGKKQKITPSNMIVLDDRRVTVRKINGETETFWFDRVFNGDSRIFDLWVDIKPYLNGLFNKEKAC
jgi:hypothetical protein